MLPSENFYDNDIKVTTSTDVKQKVLGYLIEYRGYLVLVLIFVSYAIFNVIRGGSASAVTDFSDRSSATDSKDAKQNSKSIDVKPEGPFSADIQGAVEYPGVYIFEEGEQVIDLLTLAGGLTEDAAKLVDFTTG